MNSNKFKYLHLFGKSTFWLAVLCALLFSTSGWLVKWLGDSFTETGQLVVRAGVALVVSILWLAVVGVIDRSKKNQEAGEFNLRAYNKKWLVLVLLCRPLFNLFFILSITSKTATIALMILLFVKMLTNVVINCVSDKKIPTVSEFIGYLVVTAGIVIYGWKSPGSFSPVLLFAVGSGILEAVRLELIKVLKVRDLDRPKFAVIEFAGMLIVALIFLGFGFYSVSHIGFFVGDAVKVSEQSLIAMIILPLSSVVILSLDYFIAPRMPTGLYSAILATELGFAGVINYIFLQSPFETAQIIGLLISMTAIIVIKLVVKKDKS